MKHTHGDFNTWITRFEDTIFGDIKTDYMNLSTRALFPMKQRMIAEYSQISTRKPQTVYFDQALKTRPKEGMGGVVEVSPEGQQQEHLALQTLEGPRI